MNIREQASADEVREFYRSDLRRRVGARIDGNLRIERAIDFLTASVEVNSRVLDIGCGIGIASEALARRAHQGHVTAIDISPAHIDYCRRTIPLPNMAFHTIDILADSDGDSPLAAAEFDVITMVDVIEHLERRQCLEMFERLGRLLSPKGRILITYPSPEYQRKLYATPGSRLQPVDLILELDDIVNVANASGCRLRQFRYVDAWERNQYIHCELARDVACTRPGRWDGWSTASLDERTRMCVEHVKRKLRRITRPIRKHKYLTKPLSSFDLP